MDAVLCAEGSSPCSVKSDLWSAISEMESGRSTSTKGAEMIFGGGEESNMTIVKAQ
jgi:hypothetical protein